MNMPTKRTKPKPPARMAAQRKAAPSGRKPGVRRTFSRFTVVWTDRRGVPYDTSGFFLRVYRGGRRVDTVFFDRYGVAKTDLSAPTRSSLTLRAYNPSGVLYRTRTAPAGIAFFAIIG